MKRFELTFSFLQLPIDYAALVLAGLAAYSLRYTEFVRAIRPILFNLSWPKYWPIVLIVAAGWVVIFAFAGLYHTDPNRKLTRDLNRVIFACSTGFSAITIYVFFTLSKFDSRFLVLVGWLFAMLFVCTERILMRLMKIALYRAGIGLRRTVVIGQESIAQKIVETLAARKSFGQKIVGQFSQFDQISATAILQLRPDEIIFTDPKAREDAALEAIDFANEHNITFKYSADLFDTISTNIAIATIADVPIIEIKRTRLSGWGALGKRLFDIIGSLILLIIFSPIYLICAVVIAVESGWPLIYQNERVGRHGKNFFALKFRSMYQKYCTGTQFGQAGTEALQTEAELIKNKSVKTGPVYKIKDDPRVTPFGQFIRRWSIDELPQFWNVLRGDMSLVGPRPHQPREVAQYQKHHKTVLTIKPGITGLAQISGRSDLDFETEVKLDTFYLEHWNLLIDLVILIKTPFVVLWRKGAW